VKKGVLAVRDYCPSAESLSHFQQEEFQTVDLVEVLAICRRRNE